MNDDVILLIQGCLAGDKNSWDVFDNEFRLTAEKILHRFSGVAEPDKQDIIQNVFVKLRQGGLQNFRGASKYEFLDYFKTIVRNEALNHIASCKRRNNEVSLNQERDGEDGESLQYDIADDSPWPEDLLAAKQRAGLVQKTLQEYSVKEQQIFIMKIEGHKDREIANIFGMPMGTVAVKYLRMKERLKQILGE